MAGAPGYPNVHAPPPIASPTPIISPQFCLPYIVDLIVSRKVMTLKEGSIGVTYVNGDVIFTVKGKFFSLRDRRVLLDSVGNPVVSFQQKMLTAHRRWQAFRGDSSNAEDLLFSVKKSPLLQFKTKLDVCLASNTKEDVSDFRIEGSYHERSCTIYAGASSSAIVAQMRKKHSLQSNLLDKDTFVVTCYPHVDYAFIVALIVILEEINVDINGE